ncbi:MAG TPA: YihY/virulence factor BrkB family protein [Streptosporangiaceae bacterium]|jgi:membrane protein|nr:YihY/virulence factor BrkB family protein [Streptosporangiaceae bacterium]
MSAHSSTSSTPPPDRGLPARAKGLVHAVDRAQQTRPWLAVAVATWKKFSDNKAGNLAALIAYYAFASLFPLLLVAYTILDLIARSNAKLAKRLTTALHQYPVVGTHLSAGPHQGLTKTGFALVIGILLTIYAGRGVATAIQNAMNTVWGVPQFRRPNFPKSLLRSLGLIAVLGPGEIVTIALSSVAGGTGHVGGVLAKIAAVAVSLLLNIVLFWLSFRLATSKEVSSRDMRLGVILAAVAWQILQYIAGTFIGHATNSAYGVFGIVLGLLAWFYLQAQITLYVVELDVVRARRLWPRSLVPPPLTDADMEAYQMYAESGLLRPDLSVEVREAPRASQDSPPAQQ